MTSYLIYISMGPKKADNTGKGNKPSLSGTGASNTTGGGTTGEQGH